MRTDQLEPCGGGATTSPISGLLAEFGVGDLREAVTAAYRVHSTAVYRLALRTGGPTFAEDVTQEVFLHLWTCPGRFDPARGSLRSFLLTVGHHTAIDMLRSEDSRHAREQRTSSASNAPPENVDHNLLEAERASWVAQALNELPLGERQAIVTAFYGQCTYQETASVLGLPEGTIKSRIRLGLRRLRTTQASLTAFMRDG